MPTYYTPDTLLKEMEADLTAWVQERKGTLSLALDPYHFLELLAESPVGWRAVLHWDGESNPGDEPRAGVFAAQRLSIGVTANLGLTAVPSDALTRTNTARQAFLATIAELRERVRGYVWPNQITGRYMLYKGADPVVLPESNLPLAAYRLNFELTIGLPQVVYRNLA